MRWTPELDQIILRCRKHRVGYDVIALRIRAVSGEIVAIPVIRDRARRLREQGAMPMATAGKWSAEMDAKLRDLVALGLPYSQVSTAISREFGKPVSRCACIGRAKRIGLSVAMVSPEIRRERVRKMANRQAAARKAASTRRLQVFARERLSDRIEAAMAAMPADERPRLADDLPPLVASLTDLEPHHCRWAIGDRGPYQFCGREKLAGTSWCITHARRVFSAPASTVAKVSVETAGKPVRKVA